MSLAQIAARDNTQARTNAHYLRQMSNDLVKAEEQRKLFLKADGFCEHGIWTQSLMPCKQCNSK